MRNSRIGTTATGRGQKRSALFPITLVVAGFLLVAGNASADDHPEEKKEWWCHATSSETNPYNALYVSVNAGHDGHEDDLGPWDDKPSYDECPDTDLIVTTTTTTEEAATTTEEATTTTERASEGPTTLVGSGGPTGSDLPTAGQASSQLVVLGLFLMLLGGAVLVVTRRPTSI